MMTHPAWDSLRLMAHSRCANAKILLVFFLQLHLSLESQNIVTWFTQLGFSFRQREFMTQFPCLSL